MNLVNKEVTTDIILNPLSNLENIVDSFINSQDVMENSKKLYRRTLKQFFNWIEITNYSLKEISRPHILEYKRHLLASNLSSLTVGSYITAVRKFYEFTEANKIYPNIAKGIKTPKRIQQFKKQPLQPQQAIQLINYYSELSKRDFAIINLLLRGGLRTI